MTTHDTNEHPLNESGTEPQEQGPAGLSKGVGDLSSHNGFRPRTAAIIGIPLTILVVAIGFVWIWFFRPDQSPAAAIPATVNGYLAIDVARLAEPDVRELLSTFGDMFEALDEGSTTDGLTDDTDLLAELDDQMMEELGFDFSNDIRPWVGRTIGIGVELDEAVFDPELQALLDPAEILEGLLVISVRDEEAADAFLSRLAGDDELEFDPVDVEGLPFYSAGGEPRTMVGRADDVMYVGTEDMVGRALGLESEDSLLNDATFDELTSSLPDDRFVTAFMSFDADAMASNPGLIATPSRGAVSVSLRDGGIRVDAVSSIPESYPFDETTDWQLLSRLDDSTLAFMQTASVATVWELVNETIAGIDESVAQQFEADLAQFRSETLDELGFDPIDDVVLLLDGPTTFAATYSETSSIYRESGVPVGLLAAFGTSAPDDLTATLDQARAWADSQGLPLVEREGVYVAEDGGAELFAAGIVDRWLAIATSADQAVALSESPAVSLTSSEDYLRARAELGEHIDSVYAYANLAMIFERYMEDDETLEAVAPLRSFIAGTSATDDGLVIASAVLVVDTGDE